MGESTVQKKKQKPVKIPVIMQMEALECGAACLAMIMAYYGKWVPLEEVRSDCGVSRDGSKAKNILRAARSYGLEAKGYRYTIEYLMENVTFPCIVFWDFNHFLVVDGFKNGLAYLNDPARGRIAVPMKEFDECYTGVCLTFSPTEAFEPGGKPKSLLGFAREKLKGNGQAIRFTFVAAALSTLIGIITPGFSRAFLDRVLVGDENWSNGFFTIFGIFIIVELLVAFAGTAMQNHLNDKMTAMGNAEYFWKVLHLPMQFFSQRSSGDVFQRQALNSEIASTLVNTATPVFLQVIMLVFYLVVMIHYSVPLSIFGIITVVLNVLVATIITRHKMNYTRVLLRDEAKLATSTVSGLKMIETIKSSGSENGFFRKWSGYQARVNSQEVQEKRFEELLGMIPDIVNSVNDALVVTFGVWLVMNGHFTLGMLTAFQGYLESFLAPAQELITAAEALQETQVQMERIEDVMKYPVDRVDMDMETPEDGYSKLSGQLSMKNVTFGYSKLDEPLIRDFSLELEPGKSVAFVGRSGCGKSTLAKLISRLYDPWEGEISFDGKPIKEINPRIFTGSVAVVDQDVVLFEDTIANNIKMWDESIEDFEMILAARDAMIHEDILLRQNGFQHVLKEGGRDFSGGQRQRLEIARALAQDPTIIILDEATSALDAKTEHDVVQAITDRGITCIVVAHRLSTIRDCDEIIVLDYGEVVERGTHQELFAKGGLYTELVSGD